MSTPSPIDLLRQFVDPYDAERERLECYDAMMNRVNVLTESAWERRVDKNSVEAWLQNFNGMTGSEVEIEQLHALYLLSQFLYFGVKEIRVLLTSLYRDLYQIPLVQEIRQKHAFTRDVDSIEMLYGIELDSTKFLGVGNPSESGVHLLYYFRQENDLRKSNFLDASQILKLENGVKELRFPMAKKYVFLDDICGSGDTICDYADLHLAQLKQDHPQLDFSYHCIFATQKGMTRVRSHPVFGQNAKAIFELDESYASLSDGSRYFKIKPSSVEEQVLKDVGLKYGERIAPGHGGGWDNAQLLLGFSHNIPDNTLPIIWRDPKNGSPVAWTAAMRRYMKV